MEQLNLLLLSQPLSNSYQNNLLGSSLAKTNKKIFINFILLKSNSNIYTDCFSSGFPKV
jgi:hypothetical protein